MGRVIDYDHVHMNYFSQAVLLLKQKTKGMSGPARLWLRIVILFTGLFVTIRNESGLKKMPDCAVYAVNHSTEFDAFIVPCFLIAFGGRKISFFIHWMFRKFPVVGWFLKQIDPIWVENRETKKKWLQKYKHKKHGYPVKEAVKRILAGNSVGIFPEGGLNRSPARLVRGRLGIGEIVLQTNSIVIPVGVDFPVRQKSGKLPAFGRIIITIGQPLQFDPLHMKWKKLSRQTNLDEKKLRLQKNDLCAEVAHTVMRAVSPLCGKYYPF